MSALFQDLDQAVSDCLVALPTFTGPPAVPVLLLRDGDFATKIKSVVAGLGAGGGTVTIFPPVPVSPPPSVDEEACEIRVEVGEKFLFSRPANKGEGSGGAITGDGLGGGETTAGSARAAVLAALRNQEFPPYGLLVLDREEVEEAADGRLHKLYFRARLLVTFTTA